MEPKLSDFEPQERLKQLTKFSEGIEVDYHVSPRKYYRSGLEMVRMANVYHEEGSLENAYILYLKFMTLFLEKIRKHPEFNTVPKNEKEVNKIMLRDVLPKTEKLREQLLQQYANDYKKYEAQLKKRQEEEEKLRRVEQSKPSVFDNVTHGHSFGPLPSSTEATNFYPTNFRKRGLRKVLVPSRVMGLFENMADSNTKQNIETCGILAGKLESNILIITHMILPKQKGTSDSCTTMNEEEIFEHQDKYNLITIGWIHTHPTQSAFLSSVDLHTQLPYQLLMPEAIAVVCAPKHNETGVFILTPDYGLNLISSCRQTGFHPHPTNPPIFMVAEHVKIDYEAPLEVVDLRNINL